MRRMKHPLQGVPWLFVTIGAGLLVIGFVAAYSLAFPQTILQQRLEYELALRCPYPVHLQQAALHPPLTLSIEGVTVEDLPLPFKALAIRQIKVNPRWISLLTGKPGLNFDAAMQQARVTGSWQRDGQVSVAIQELPLPPWLPETLGLNLSGIIKQGTFEALINGQSQSPESSKLRLEASSLVLTGLQKYGLSQDQIGLGTAHIVTSSKNNRLDIEQMTITGGDLDISVSGTILLATPLPHSHLNLRLTLRPGRNLDPAAVELLAAMVKPAADNSMQMTITGSAGKPKLQ